jgi:nitroreductase
MNVKEAIEARRSIRWYDGKKVTAAVISEVLDAARRAPSGCNAQPWRFYVVQDSKTAKLLQKHKAFPQDFVYKAPAIIVCCGDAAAYAGRYGGENQVEDGTVPEDPEKRKAMFSIVMGRNATRTIRDVSIASAFLVLRATELGLGTSYIGLIDEAAIRKALNLPERLVIPFVITMGYPAQIPSRTPRKELKDIWIEPSKLVV